MIVIEPLSKNHPQYGNGVRFAMTMNGFATFYLTESMARELHYNLDFLLRRS